MNKIRVSAKTQSEAITKALIQLSTTSDRLDYKVLAQGSAGLFGIGAKPWIIEASVREGSDDIEKLEKEIKNIAAGKVSTGDIKETEKPSAEAVAVKPAVPKTDTSEKMPENQQAKKPDAKSAAEGNVIKTSAEHPVQTEAAERSFHSEHQERRPRKDFGRGDHRKFSKGGYHDANVTAPAESAEPVKKHEIKPVSEEEAKESQARAEEFITSVLKGMNMDVNLSSSFDHETNELLLNMEGPDMGIMIGKRGQTLDSLQYLASLVVNREHKDDYIRVKLDTEDYRKRRESTLRNLARNIAYKVKRTRKPVALEPMNPYERRIIHSALQGDRFVTTKSEGEEPFRHVIIFLKK